MRKWSDSESDIEPGEREKEQEAPVLGEGGPDLKSSGGEGEDQVGGASELPAEEQPQQEELEEEEKFELSEPKRSGDCRK